MNKYVIFLIIVTASILGTIGNALLKLAASININSISILNIKNELVIKKFFLYGLSITFYAGGFVVWGYLLSKFELNKAYPIYTAITFILIVLSSIMLFNEKVTINMILGYIFILIGIYLAS